MHLALLQRVPFVAHPTGRTFGRDEVAISGAIGVYCPRCKLFTEYAVAEAA